MSDQRYQTGDLLGRGGMADVYSGVDTRLGRPVAIKRLREDLAANPTLRTRFRREASAAARLNHPSIVAVFDTAELETTTGAPPVPIIVMELVDGSTLREALRDGPGLTPPDRALEITVAILGALAASHSAGIIHRDIKPANVLLTSTGEIKVADFGIARSVADTSATMTQTATVMGTAQYMSPEQARGLTVDHRSDLYSVGCLLYELLVGRPPFIGDSPLSITYQHVAEPPPAPSTAEPELSSEIDAIVGRALQKDPGDRYQTADQMKADIVAVRSGHPLPSTATTAIPTPPDRENLGAQSSHPVPLRPAHQPITPWVLALVVLLTIAVAGFGFLRTHHSPSATASEVPAVLGFNRAEAESLVQNAHLVARVQLVKGSTANRNTVIGQSPEGGEQVVPNSTVTLQISTGPADLTVPTGLVGTTVSQADRRLKEAGFTNVTTRPVTARNTGEPAGTVIAVDPAGGRTVSPTAPITLSYTTDTGQTTTSVKYGTGSSPDPDRSDPVPAPVPSGSAGAQPAPDSETASRAGKSPGTARAPKAAKPTRPVKEKTDRPKKARPHPKK